MSNLAAYSFLSQLPVKILIFFIIFLLFYGLGQVARYILRRKMKIKIVQKEVITFISDLSFYLFLLLGILIGLNALGLSTSAIIGSLGLGGFALGLAFKDIIANFISGLLIILSKTLRVGDTLKINNFEGTVKSINLRQTVLINKNDPEEEILIPNSNLFSSIISVREKKK